MATLALKQLKTKVFAYGDGSESHERFAVHSDGDRVGTVCRITFSSGAVAIEACPGKGEKPLVVDYAIQRFDTLADAASACVR